MNVLSKTLVDTAVPLYVALADQLRQRIDRGMWRAGDSLPSLHQIAQEFGVARLTARQAVQRLVTEGLLTSRRGQGTVVTDAATQVKTALLESSLVELGQSYRDLVPLILDIDESPRALVSVAGKDEGYVYARRQAVLCDFAVYRCIDFCPGARRLSHQRRGPCHAGHARH